MPPLCSRRPSRLRVRQSSWLLRVSRPRPFLRPPWFLVTLTNLRSAGRAFCGRSLGLAVLVFSTIALGCECLEGGPQGQTRFLSRRVKGAHGRGASSLSMLTLLSWLSCVCKASACKVTLPRLPRCSLWKEVTMHGSHLMAGVTLHTLWNSAQICLFSSFIY